MDCYHQSACLNGVAPFKHTGRRWIAFNPKHAAKKTKCLFYCCSCVKWPQTVNTAAQYHCLELTVWHRSFTFNSNKSPTWCNSFSVYYPGVCLQLNIFRAFSRPSSGDQWPQWQPLVLPSYRGDSRAVFVVWPAGPNVRIINRKTVTSGWWFIWIKCKTPMPKG